MIPLLDPKLQRQDNREPLGTWRAVIASSPASTAELVDVTIPAFSADHRWVSCPWTPRVAVADDGVRIVAPARGDEAIVSLDEDEQPWVLCYFTP